MDKNEIKKIIILTTGGTIEKTYDEEDGTLFNRETVLKTKVIDKLRLPYTQVEVKSLMSKDSLDMDEQDRGIISQAVDRFQSYGTPIVVIHGTDTMQQTAEVVFKKIPNLKVPVVFTGAMKPFGFDDSDAYQNVSEAIYASLIAPPGVYISFHNRLFKVPGVRKNKVKRTFEAF